MIYFIADTHFCHSGSLKWTDCKYKRKFNSIEEANEVMISNWNSVVKDIDEVYFLGDFAYKCSKNKAESIFWRLNGKKHLIKGNHDYKIAAKFENCWESISDIKQIDYINPLNGCKKEIILCHYPMISWKHKEKGSIHLHGHTHGSIQDLNEKTNRYDVGVEVSNYTPISIEQIIKYHEKT